MRILVIGAGGFLGGAVARRLTARGDIEVVAAVRRPTALLPDARTLELGDKAAIGEMLGAVRPDVVVHAAGRTPGSPDAFAADNVAATANLAQAIGESAPQPGLILLGSAAQYGRSASRTPWRESDPHGPADAYGASKQAAEAAAALSASRLGFRLTVLRLFNVISAVGDGDSAFASFTNKAVRAVGEGPPFTVEMGPLGAVRDFVAPDDFLQAVERVIDRRVWDETINICTGVGRTVRALIEAALARIDLGLALVEAGAAPSLLDWSVGDPSLCQARLGFTPSSDLTPLLERAAAKVRAAALVRPDA